MAGGINSSNRRIAAAVLKIDQFLLHLDRIAESGFPHDDGRTALRDIKRIFSEKREKLLLLPRGSLRSLEDQFFRDVRDLVSSYTKVLGIILRSTNLRNNFEVYYPLKKLAKKFIGSEVRLLISSEWEFIPFTYPMNIAGLPGLIIVGAPATEAQNLLVIPLAGHEIGHSVWVRRRLARFMKPVIDQAIDAYLKTDKVARERVQPISEGLDLTPDAVIGRLFVAIERKCEEVFCDLLGLSIFGVSYILAFEYYMAPGKAVQSPVYPADYLRARILAQQSRRLGISIPNQFTDNWEEPPKLDGAAFVYEIADQILINLVDSLAGQVDEAMKEAGLATPSVERIQLISQSFSRFEPFGDAVELAEIVCALWERSAKMIAEEKFSSKAILDLTEVALKSVEVSEYNDKLIRGQKVLGE